MVSDAFTKYVIIKISAYIDHHIPLKTDDKKVIGLPSKMSKSIGCGVIYPVEFVYSLDIYKFWRTWFKHLLKVIYHPLYSMKNFVTDK